MKELITFIPHQGIEWRKRELFLEGEETELLKMPVNYEKHGNSYYYFSRDLRVDVDENHKIEFIEFSGNRFGMMRALLCDKFVLEDDVEDVLHHLEKYSPIEEKENGHLYVLTALDAALWRERTEADVEAFIADMKADGIETEGNPDVESEWKLAKQFSTVSIGKKGYFTK